jgi:predicted Zn-dependent protease
MKRLAQRLGLSRYQADERYHAALRAYRERKLSAALAEVKVAIELLPTQAEYFAALGYFHLEDKDDIGAQEAFARALKMYPYEMLANFGQGMIAYRDKDWEGAAACFTNALAAQPERAETQYYLAMVNHRLGHNPEALQWMRSAADLFARAEDRREGHCHAWIKEFVKLI